MECNRKSCLYCDEGECYRLNQTVYGENCIDYVDGDQFIVEQQKLFLSRTRETYKHQKDQ